MNSETPEQKEERINRSAETWMHSTSRKFRMRWLVLPANVAMTRSYITRYFFAMFARVTLMYLLMLVGMFLVMIIIAAMYDRRFHGLSTVADPAFLKATLIPFLGGIQIMSSLLVFFTLLLSSGPTFYLVHCSRYWNQRARRLQENLDGFSEIVHDISVWPPPPRIVD